MMDLVKLLVTGIFGWLTSKQEAKNTQAEDVNIKDTNTNIHAQQLDDQTKTMGIYGNFWLVTLEAMLTIIVIYNTAAFGFGFTLFQTQYDPLTLLLSLGGIHIFKLGHKYVQR